MPLARGTVLNDIYTIEQVLGVGGFGVTYRAVDVTTGRFVAIKENFPSFLAQRDALGSVILTGDVEQYKWALRHFKQESTLLTRMNHPGIVRGYGIFEAFNTAYFVMEYVEGKSLEKLRNPGEWTEEELRYLLSTLLDVLIYMQKHKICHRDIKPANIMLRTSGHPVLIDFGAAKREVSQHTYSCNFMSNGYTPPEQLADLNCIAPSIDVYALGATFYFLLTGSPPPPVPERQLNPERDTYKPLAGNKRLRKRFSEQLLVSIDSALQLSAKNRFPDAKRWLKFLQSDYKPLRHKKNKKKELPPPTPPKKTAPAPPPPHAPNEPIYRDAAHSSCVAKQQAYPSYYGSPSASSSHGDEDEIIPISTVLRWGANIMLTIGGILLMLMLISLGAATGGSYALDSCLPLALFLLVVGFLLRLILRFSDSP